MVRGEAAGGRSKNPVLENANTYLGISVYFSWWSSFLNFLLQCIACKEIRFKC